MELSFQSILFIIGFVISCFFIIFPKQVTLGKKKRIVSIDYSTVPICIVLLLFITTSIPWVVIVRGLLGANSPEWAKDPSNSSYLVPYTVVILCIYNPQQMVENLDMRFHLFLPAENPIWNPLLPQ